MINFKTWIFPISIWIIKSFIFDQKKLRENNLWKNKNKKNFNKNQQSFFFEDYLSTIKNLGMKRTISLMKIEYIYFFSFFFLILIFSLKIIFVSFQKSNLSIYKNYQYNFNPIRNDIIDRNGVLLSRNITAYHAAINQVISKTKKIFS